eukprot:NODE_4608_length_1870_cov_4.893287.p1 GENE.NODE_4608_length_1870_cov_4.893287~~NODE_4608_length_1870_cov_4.893287.p1  ORF type:complete len:561 (+),score=82.98 NODE_4608_length_1870_cov_4.893287:129-1685(+)
MTSRSQQGPMVYRIPSGSTSGSGYTRPLGAAPAGRSAINPVGTPYSPYTGTFAAAAGGGVSPNYAAPLSSANYVQTNSRVQSVSRPQVYRPQEAQLTNWPNTIRELIHDEGKLKAKLAEISKAFHMPLSQDHFVEFVTCFDRDLRLNDNLVDKSALQPLFSVYDFDGNGYLELLELLRFARNHLGTILEKCGEKVDLPVPMTSPEMIGITVQQELAAGGQGSVYKAIRRGETIVLKVYDKSCQNAGDIADLRSEMEVMKAMEGKSEDAQHIAHAYEIFQDQQHLYMTSQLCAGGDLTKLRANAAKQHVNMTENWWKAIFKQCFSALKYIHERSFMHRDIKEANIMIKAPSWQKPHIVVIDLGLASTIDHAVDSGICGTPGYIPPETWRTTHWYPRGDIFSMGVVVYQLLTNTVDNPVFVSGASSMDDVKLRTLEYEPPLGQLPFNNRALEDFVKHCLMKERSLRPRGPDIVGHRWLQGVDGPSVNAQKKPVGRSSSCWTGICPARTRKPYRGAPALLH